MTFYHVPIHPRTPFRLEWLIFLVGLFVVLLTMFIVTTLDRYPKERIIQDSAIATLPLNGPPKTWNPANHPVQIKVAINRTTAPLKATIHTTPLELSLIDLLKGPTAAEMKAGHFSEIPSGTNLLGVTVSGNLVTVNLSERFATGGGSNSMIGRVEELNTALHRINRHYKLRLALNGRPVQYIGGEGLEIE